MKQTIWYDVTEVKDWSGHFTGIQRFIVEVGKQLILNDQFEVKFCYFERSQQVFKETEYSFAEHEYDANPPVEIDNFKTKLKRLAKKHLTPETRQTLKRAYAKLSYKKTQVNPVPVDQIQLSAADILFIPGAMWTGMLDAAERIKQTSNPMVVGVMFDLVPIIVPQFAADVTVITFKREIDKAVRIMDHWFAISENTKKDFLAYANKNSSALKADQVSVVQLGSDININGSSQRPKEKLLGNEFILFVSTLEARKNQLLVYQTVKRAIELKIKIPPIILVGKHGWLTDDLVYVLRNDPEIKERLIWLDRVDDKGLRWLYQNCKFTVYPSLYEGWGLPIAESLAYGKPCISSNTSSMPEVAGDLIDYISPYDSDELLKLISKYANDQDYYKKQLNKIKNFPIHTWKETGIEVTSIMTKLTKNRT